MKKSATIAISVFSFLLTIIPEQQFLRIKLFKSISDERNIIINRVLFLFVLMIVTAIIYKIVVSIKWWRTIKGRNYTIVVKYQDIFEAKNCKKVIPFDECYTVEIGNAPGEIKLGSICGQYLQKYPITNMQSLLDGIQLKSKGKSMYQNKEKYESGRLIPVNEFLLLSFAKLDKDAKYISWQSIKLIEAILVKLSLSVDNIDIASVMSPLYILHDYRILLDHLLSAEKISDTKQHIVSTLGVQSFNDQEAIYNEEIKRLNTLFNYLGVLSK